MTPVSRTLATWSAYHSAQASNSCCAACSSGDSCGASVLPGDDVGGDVAGEDGFVVELDVGVGLGVGVRVGIEVCVGVGLGMGHSSTAGPVDSAGSGASGDEHPAISKTADIPTSATFALPRFVPIGTTVDPAAPTLRRPALSTGDAADLGSFPRLFTALSTDSTALFPLVLHIRFATCWTAAYLGEHDEEVTCTGEDAY